MLGEGIEKKKKKKLKRVFLFLVRLTFALTVSLGVCQFQLENIESFLYDLRVRLKPTSELSGKIQTVAITKNTLDKLESFPKPYHYAQVIENLRAADPAAIVVLKRPNTVEGTDEEKKTYAQKLEKLDRIYFPGTWTDYYAKSLEHKLYLSSPFEKTKLSMGTVTPDIRHFAQDSVARSFLTSYYDQEMLQPQMARQLTGYKGPWRGDYGYYHSTRVYIDYRPKGTYPRLFFEDILEGKFDKESLKGQLIILGDDSSSHIEDYAHTPYSRSPLAMSTLEIQANMFDTLILNSAPVRLSDRSNKVVTSVIAFFTVYVVMAFNPATGLLTLLITFLGFVLISYLLLAFAGIWLVMIHPLLAVFICYYFSIPYRLIIENRRSWEYFQKHRLLKQVEELKTNFLSMMSHDIKTPIARIQGMSEILMQEQDRLSDKQKDAVRTVQSSVSELSEFISTVLDLGRIENQQVKLKLQSKDVNTLLKEVIEKHSFQAKQKGVQIIPELEPLFSIKIDVELIRQVFANLVENAIKYSPENSKVLISCEEEGDKIIVQIADQGQGIAEDELDNIFMKFYRSKNAKNSPIKGSGLGLYLAKYFVELHGGDLTVESSRGQGSTFTVTLSGK